MNGCPGADRLGMALEGRLSRAEAEPILEHAPRCPACAPILQEHRALADALRSGGPSAASRCPSPEQLSTVAAGAVPDAEMVAHLADCLSCREDLVETRALLAEKGKTEHPRAAFRGRVQVLGPRRSRELVWIGVAAAALFVIVLGVTLLGRSEGTPMAVPPRPAPQVAREPVAPEPPKPVPPAPAPEKPAPVIVEPEKPSVPVVEKPAPEPPKRTLPPPAPEVKPPAPTVEPKPAPPAPRTEPTREKPRIAGNVMALVGTLSSRAEGDAAWQPTRVAQSREFAGAIDVRADASPIKLKLGAHTLLLKGRTELSVALEEGGTRVRLARGEAIFDVSGAFSVQTANAMISVTGTRFLVSGDADETEVVVQRGGVELAAAEKSVKLGPSERSVAAAGKAPSAPARADLAKRLQWARALEETLTIEAELMALQKGMSVIADAGASGGRGIGVKGPVAAGTEATAEARVQVKQPVPYSVWMRIQWNHGVAPAFTLQVHEHPKASPHGVAAKPGWQWVRAGSYDVPADGFRLRVADGQGGVRIDRLVVTSDPEYVPE